MKLFVDYTNWKGKREWREILNPTEPFVGKYYLAGHDEPENCVTTWLLRCQMVDRGGAIRTLRLDQIHAFKVEAQV